VEAIMTRRELGRALTVAGVIVLSLLAPVVWSAPGPVSPDLDQALGQARRGELKNVEEGLIARLRKDDPQAPRIVQALVEGYLQTYRYRAAEECLQAWAWLYRKQEDPQALFLLGLVRERSGGNQTWGNTPSYLAPDAKAELRDRSRREMWWSIGSGSATAVEAYQRVLELDPKHDEARLRLAQILLTGMRANEALAHLQELRKRRPKDSEVLLALAQGEAQMGKLTEAAKLLDALLAQHPKSVPALTERGRLALQNNQVAEAETCLRQAVAGDPFDRAATYALFMALTRNGKGAEASQQRVRLERIEQDLRRLDELTAQMDLTPHDPALDYQIGMVLLRNGREKDGVRWLGYALLEDPRHRPSHGALAEYYERTGDKQAAERHRREAKSK
jgi:tetratricopeptide (TPR) repeat protein